jgi:hypothetical protein
LNEGVAHLQVDVISLKTGPFGWTGCDPSGERLGAPMREIIGNDLTYEEDGDGADTGRVFIWDLFPDTVRTLTLLCSSQGILLSGDQNLPRQARGQP